ncbi:MAG: thioredoxin [Clostridiales bacterium]|nr:thioredoxin [Clostridiales bacterium]
MNDIKEILGKEEFAGVLLDNKLVLVDFYATWCGPCKMQSPILHDFKAEIKEKVEIIKVDVDQNPDIAKDFGILSIPTLLLFKEGELVEKSVGLSTKAQLSEMIIKHI